MSRKTRRHRQQREAQASQQPAQQTPNPDDVALDPLDALNGDGPLEADDDFDEDLDGDEVDLADGGAPAQAAVDGSGTQEPVTDPDPFATLQRQYNETKAAREAAEARVKEKEAAETRFRAEAEAERSRAERERADREEAETRLREEQGKRTELERYRIQTDRDRLVDRKASLEHAYAAAGGSKLMAQRAYAEAMAVQDYAKAAEAQETISAAVFEERRLAEEWDTIEAKISAPLPEYTPEPLPERPASQATVPAEQDPFEAAIANLGDTDKQWLRLHKADLANPRREQLLRSFAVQAETPADLGGEGLTPGTREYHQFLDECMGYSQPENDPPVSDPVPPPAPVRQQPPRQGAQQSQRQALPSAPPSRSADPGGGGGSEVRLTRDERQTARDMNMSAARYYELKQKIASGQTNLKFSNEGYAQ